MICEIRGALMKSMKVMNLMKLLDIIKEVKFKYLVIFNKTRLRTKLITFTIALFFIQLVLLYAHISYIFSSEYKSVTSQATLNSAQVIANTKEVRDFMLSNKRDIAKIDNILTTISQTSNLTFIVLLESSGIRAYHPVKENIGKYVVGR